MPVLRESVSEGLLVDSTKRVLVQLLRKHGIRSQDEVAALVRPVYVVDHCVLPRGRIGPLFGWSSSGSLS